MCPGSFSNVWDVTVNHQISSAGKSALLAAQHNAAKPFIHLDIRSVCNRTSLDYGIF